MLCLFVLAFGILGRHTEATRTSTQTLWIEELLELPDTLAAALRGGKAGRETSMHNITHILIKSFHISTFWFIWVLYSIHQVYSIISLQYSSLLLRTRVAIGLSFQGQAPFGQLKLLTYHVLPYFDLQSCACECTSPLLVFETCCTKGHEFSHSEQCLLVEPYSFSGAAQGFNFKYIQTCKQHVFVF